jgi:UDP-N-acetylglucosamine 1-carboxyvinyltransferase
MSTATIAKSDTDYKQKIGNLIRQNRLSRGLTQAQLASALGTSQSAVGRIEGGGQNLSMEMLARISDILNRDIISLNQSGALNFRIQGGHKLRGSIEVKTSKNAAMGLMAASLLNRGTTTLRRMPRIEEVNRMTEVLASLGVAVRWLPNSNDLEIKPPAKLRLGEINAEAGRKTRSVIMLMGPLLHLAHEFKLPYAGGCNLGDRNVRPHLWALENFGLSVKTTQGYYHCTSHPQAPGSVVMYEVSDTTSENALMAAALTPGVTTLKDISANYMVRDVCYFLEALGVKIEGIGTSILKVHGLATINQNVEYWPSEDPIEAMTFLSIAATTNSPITIARAPLDFIELELFRLRLMGFKYTLSPSYKARNGHTDLVDIACKTTPRLIALEGGVYAQPFPGVNMDNLPYFVPVAATALGRTLIHDWVYDNRAIYYTELNKLGANIQLIDVHRAYVDGPTRWKAGEVISPPALRPAVLVLIAMLAAPGTSVLRNVYSISRGYEDIAERLNGIGAKIEVFRDL